MTAPHANSLPWPPDGLSPLRGRVDRAARHLWWSATLTALLATVALDRGSMGSAFDGLDTAGVLTGALIVHALWLLWALDLVRGASMACWRGVRAGFGWLTLLEVGADVRGDTGDLIATRGAAAALDATQRRGLRAARLIATFATLLSAVGTLLAFFGIVRFGSPDADGRGALLAIAAVALLGAVVRGTMRAWERSQLPRDRWATRMRPLPELRERAAAWMETFGRHSDPAGFGAGPATGAIAAQVWHGVILVLGILAFIVTMFIVVAHMAGEVIVRTAAPELQSIERRYEAVGALRRWALPVDTSITPLAAGIAFATMDHRRDVNTGAFVLRDRAPLPAPPWTEPGPAGLGAQSRGVASAGEPWIDSVTRRLTPAELAWMREVTAYAGWREMAAVARAPRADFVGGRFELPFPENADVFAMPISSVAVYRDYGRANAYRVRYYLETNRPDSAVIAARELLSVGLRLADDARWAIESLIGMVLANQARNQLERTYAVLRDSQRDTLLRVTRDAAQQSNERRRSALDRESAQDNAARILDRFARLAADDTRLRSIRWEAMSILGFSVCTSPRSLLRGPSQEQRARFDAFVAAETQWASDTAMIELMRDRPLQSRQTDGDRRVAYRAVDVLAALLGSPYLSSCARFMGDLGI